MAVSAQVLLPDGTQHQVQGGCWLRDDVCVATGRELVRLRRETVALKVALVGLGVVTAGVAGWALHGELSRASH